MGADRTMQLTIKQMGQALTLTLPRELIIALDLQNGSQLFLTETAQGYLLSTTDPSFELKLNAAKKGIDRYRNTLHDLAQ
jgi:antitoxin component of MazEF toxin-antitoxin module